MAFRLIGGILFVSGLLLTITAFIDFFSEGFPTKFWMFFAGMPLMFFGGALLQMGFMGTITRYTAGELAPVGVDTVNYMGEGAQPGLRFVGKAFGEGISEGMNQGNIVDPPPPPPPGFEEDKGTVRERLEKLETLHKDGLIDDEDFEEQKDRILNDL